MLHHIHVKPVLMFNIVKKKTQYFIVLLLVMVVNSALFYYKVLHDRSHLSQCVRKLVFRVFDLV